MWGKPRTLSKKKPGDAQKILNHPEGNLLNNWLIEKRKYPSLGSQDEGVEVVSAGKGGEREKYNIKVRLRKRVAEVRKSTYRKRVEKHLRNARHRCAKKGTPPLAEE